MNLARIENPLDQNYDIEPPPVAWLSIFRRGATLLLRIQPAEDLGDHLFGTEPRLDVYADHQAMRLAVCPAQRGVWAWHHSGEPAALFQVTVPCPWPLAPTPTPLRIEGEWWLEGARDGVVFTLPGEAATAEDVQPEAINEAPDPAPAVDQPAPPQLPAAEVVDVKAFLTSKGKIVVDRPRGGWTIDAKPVDPVGAAAMINRYRRRAGLAEVTPEALV